MRMSPRFAEVVLGVLLLQGCATVSTPPPRVVDTPTPTLPVSTTASSCPAPADGDSPMARAASCLLERIPPQSRVRVDAVVNFDKLLSATRAVELANNLIRELTGPCGSDLQFFTPKSYKYELKLHTEGKVAREGDPKQSPPEPQYLIVGELRHPEQGERLDLTLSVISRDPSGQLSELRACDLVPVERQACHQPSEKPIKDVRYFRWDETTTPALRKDGETILKQSGIVPAKTAEQAELKVRVTSHVWDKLVDGSRQRRVIAEAVGIAFLGNEPLMQPLSHSGETLCYPNDLDKTKSSLQSEAVSGLWPRLSRAMKTALSQHRPDVTLQAPASLPKAGQEQLLNCLAWGGYCPKMLEQDSQGVLIRLSGTPETADVVDWITRGLQCHGWIVTSQHERWLEVNRAP